MSESIISKAKAVIELTKPRALVMIVWTTCFGYLIGITEPVDFLLLIYTALGVGVSGAGALAFNQYMERELDGRMNRTRLRPIPSGRIAPRTAFWLGLGAMVVGYGFLWFMVNPICSAATMACGLSYLFLYTPMKLTSSFSSFVGAIPGGLLPVMGWAAARGKLELGAWVLFVILFLWQIPHALIISIRHREDYRAVGMKQLPIILSQQTSRRQMVLNVSVLIPVSLLPGFLNMTENLYPVLALALGSVLLVLVLNYVFRVTDRSAQTVFIYLSAYLPLLMFFMFIDKPA